MSDLALCTARDSQVPLVKQTIFLARTLLVVVNGKLVPVGILASPELDHPMALAVVKNPDVLGLPTTSVPALRVLEGLSEGGKISEMDVPNNLLSEFELSDVLVVMCADNSVANMARSVLNEIVLQHPLYEGKDIECDVFELDTAEDLLVSV
jgi:hypothetical protein